MHKNFALYVLAAAAALSSQAALARVNVDIGIGVPVAPVYVEPACTPRLRRRPTMRRPLSMSRRSRSSLPPATTTMGAAANGRNANGANNAGVSVNGAGTIVMTTTIDPAPRSAQAAFFAKPR